MNIEFYSSCYENELPRFVISVNGYDEEGLSEEIVEPLINNVAEVISEDTYEFPNLKYGDAHKFLVDLGFKYLGPVDDDAIDTSVLIKL